MSSSQERQAGASGSAVGQEQAQREAQAKMPAQPQGRDYAPAGREVQVRGRHGATTEYRGAVIAGTVLAGTLMLLGGLWMVAIAIVALSHGAVFTTAPAYTFRFNIVGWGWLELGLGILLFAAGMCVFLGMAWARYVGAFFAVLSAIANFVFIPYQPAWSIIMIALDAFIIWALLAPRRTATEI
jgi:hypothetical protein